MHVIENASLKPYNTFSVPARARYLIRLDKLEDVVALARDAALVALPKLVLGEGSNILFRGDFAGLVALNRVRGIRVVAERGTAVCLRVGAGENWHRVVRRSLAMKLSGLENLSLIPGTAGAAPVQNIGAYGVELSERFESLEAVDLRSGRVLTFDEDACGFGYRDSVFKSAEPGRYAIVSVTLKLSRQPRFVTSYRGVLEELARAGEEPVTALGISDAVSRIRRRTLPSPARLGNAGSFFKNPVVTQTFLTGLQRDFPAIPSFGLGANAFKVPAAWLIEQCGWKGYRCGDAGVHRRHALVMVNYGHATGEEIWALAEAIMASVQGRFGVRLEPEPLIL
jgi:UDP-N-acetylmuramate dehydrogenase